MRVAKTEATRSEQVHRKCRVARRGGRMRAMGYACVWCMQDWFCEGRVNEAVSAGEEKCRAGWLGRGAGGVQGGVPAMQSQCC
eukprot:861121-Pelagomonas_calceolata.AAC.1